jgi:hypothetical protein
MVIVVVVHRSIIMDASSRFPRAPFLPFEDPSLLSAPVHPMPPETFGSRHQRSDQVRYCTDSTICNFRLLDTLLAFEVFGTIIMRYLAILGSILYMRYQKKDSMRHAR